MLNNIIPDLSVDPGSRRFDRDTLARDGLVRDGAQGLRPLLPEVVVNIEQHPTFDTSCNERILMNYTSIIIGSLRE